MAKKNIKTHSKKKKAKALVEQNKFIEARELYKKVCDIDKRDADAWYMLGVINGMLGDRNAAIPCLQQAVILRPEHGASQYNLGIALRDNGDLDAAVTALSNAIRLDVNTVMAYQPLAVALMSLKRLDEAEEVFRKLLKLTPQDAEVWSNLGFLLQILGKLGDAVDCCKKAVDINPALIAPYANMANVLCSSGQYDEALVCYKICLEKNPGNARSHSNLLLTLNYIEDTDPEDIYHEHCKWGQAHGVEINALKGHKNDIDIHRVLKVAYISPDFRAHSVASYIEPILASHDKSRVDSWCYSSVPHGGDETTERLKQLAHNWCDISQMDTLQIVNQIRKDKIDILVDLAGHTSSEIMSVMSYKPAPVQVTWLGYPNTTGLATIDYRITDTIADQQGQDAYYSEKLIRLDGCFVCYLPPVMDVHVGRLPALDNSYVTFGSFNNLAKMGDSVIALWAKLLNAVENSRLFIKNPSLTDEKTRERYLQKFVSLGISGSRITLTGHTKTREEHFKMYDKLDIALDTFPYNGTTTTCESLWMGVPVISLAGKCHASRVGASLLSAIRLDSFVCDSEEAYIEKAKYLAKNIDELTEIRQMTRSRLLKSSLCNANDFTAGLESRYKRIWKGYCERHVQGGGVC